ncbi:hypothetical protein E5676_scaffold1073G00050 [Cucumis melo var. makuwa]|uniref:Uncharacterized protein n=1 Tax=Cucumis melo var. makuwa TaxID=1194695 RepID=A0A5A7V1K1_CUCMM|nr:hypothetical protein E6C27_scaffold496G00110 [Cucumis melo var. makuwa]TYK21843.1 hypothetical protein E5676_scaffold1073G00050 [Cucumis melo var. makuwa]
MSSPTTLMATSRNTLPLEPTTLTNDALPAFIQRSSRHLATTTTPTSRPSNSLKLSKGKQEQTSTATHSTLHSCKPKGPVRWSSPSPLRNNVEC